MIRALKVPLALVVALLSACTTMQELGDDAKLATELRPGDHLIVYERSGRIVDMRYVLVDDNVLRGSLFENGLEAVAIPLDAVERIEVERVHPGRTAAAVVGGVVLLPFAVLGAGIGFADSLENQ